ncbi:MAG: hypothetical protein AAF797_11205 [Planctomycetota bacterium]
MRQNVRTENYAEADSPAARASLNPKASRCVVCGVPLRDPAAAPDSLCDSCAYRVSDGRQMPEGTARSLDDFASTAPAPDESGGTGRGRLLWVGIFGGSVAVLGVVVLVAIMLWDNVASLLGEDYERGFAGTVIRYADRSYEGLSWEVVRRAPSLGNLPAPASNRDVAELTRIYGYDEDNLWVIDLKGAVFQLENGAWRFRTVIPGGNNHKRLHGGLIGPDTLLVGGQPGRRFDPAVYVIGPQGVRQHDLIAGPSSADVPIPLSPGQAILPLAPGITYIATGRKYFTSSHKIVDNTIEALDPAKGHQDSVVVDSDGSAIQLDRVGSGFKQPSVRDFWLSSTFAEGEAAAIARFEASHQYDDPMLVVYRDGTWMRVEDIRLPEAKSYVNGWLSKDDDGKHFAVLVGPGRAAVYREGNGVVTHPLTTATGVTDLSLFIVWGTGPDKFWVMDRSGSVWAFEEGRYRPLVAGMMEEETLFNHAWVAPSGTVFAVTDDTLYRLGEP